MSETTYLAHEAMSVHLSTNAEEVEEFVTAGEQALADVVAGELGLLEHDYIMTFTSQDASSVGTGGTTTDDEDLSFGGTSCSHHNDV